MFFLLVNRSKLSDYISGAVLQNPRVGYKKKPQWAIEARRYIFWCHLYDTCDANKNLHLSPPLGPFEDMSTWSFKIMSIGE